jgi:hypothetical protein
MSVELAQEALADLWSEETKIVTIEHIQRAAEFFGVSLSGLRAQDRTWAVAFPRQVTMYLARQLTHASLMEIGRAFGGKEHTTVAPPAGCGTAKEPRRGGSPHERATSSDFVHVKGHGRVTVAEHRAPVESLVEVAASEIVGEGVIGGRQVAVLDAGLLSVLVQANPHDPRRPHSLGTTPTGKAQGPTSRAVCGRRSPLRSLFPRLQLVHRLQHLFSNPRRYYALAGNF